MVKAHSLLYAIYICLIVSIICGALLYFSTLYSQLNLYYNLNEELYIQNQSYVNFALENVDENNIMSEDEQTGVISFYENKPYGLLNLLNVKTCTKLDTIISVHLTGNYTNDKTCLFIANQGNPFYFSGKVKLIGEKKLPTQRVQEKYINNEKNSFDSPGEIQLSQPDLPELNPEIKLYFEKNTIVKQLKDIEKNSNSIYFNSFKNETVEIQLPGTILENITIKGNFILHAKDSIYIKNTTVLEDVIIKSPKIIIEENFKGSMQLFATERIEIGEEAQLNYPSVLCLMSKTSEKRAIMVNEKAKIAGAIVLFHDEISKQNEDVVILKKGALLTGEVYCTGKLMVEGIIHGSVYTNNVFHSTPVSSYENCMVNSEIDITKRPSYFVSIPIFQSKNKKNSGIFKKVL